MLAFSTITAYWPHVDAAFEQAKQLTVDLRRFATCRVMGISEADVQVCLVYRINEALEMLSRILQQYEMQGDIISLYTVRAPGGLVAQYDFHMRVRNVPPMRFRADASRPGWGLRCLQRAKFCRSDFRKCIIRVRIGCLGPADAPATRVPRNSELACEATLIG